MPKLASEEKSLLDPKNSVRVYTWGMGLFIGCVTSTLTTRVSSSLAWECR